MIMACYSTYNEQYRLPISLLSIERYVNKILIVDGRFKGYGEGLPINSTDRTLDIASTFKNVEIIKCTEPMYRYEKYNKFFEVDADYYLWMDCDEIIYGYVDKGLREVISKPNVPIWCILNNVDLERLYLNMTQCIPKVFKRGCNFKFSDKVPPYYAPDGFDLSRNAPVVPYVRMISIHELQSENDAKLKERWQEYQKDKGGWW